MTENLEISIFFVRNKEGKFFRAKGYGGYGNSWVDTVKSAKMYTKIGSARSIVTFWYGAFPEYGCADIIELKTSAVNVINEEERVIKSLQKKKINDLNRTLFLARRGYEDKTRSIKQLESELAVEKTKMEHYTKLKTS